MVRSALSALAVVLVCFGIMQIPGHPDSLPLPSASGISPIENILPVPDSDEIWSAIEKLEARVESLESAKKVAASAPSVSCPSGQCPNGMCPATSTTVVRSAPVVRSQVTSSYTGRWHNNSGMSDRDHAIMEHGFDPNLSDAELARMHDSYHDQYGPASPRSTGQYTQRYSPAAFSRSVTVQSPYASNCPGGQCPTSRSMSVQSSGGVFGFGIFGRRR